MNETHSNAEDSSRCGRYEIRIEGHLNESWADWFEGLAITPEENGETLISGLVADQAALYGLLRKVRDVGLPLVSVNRVPTVQTDVLDVKP